MSTLKLSFGAPNSSTFGYCTIYIDRGTPGFFGIKHLASPFVYLLNFIDTRDQLYFNGSTGREKGENQQPAMSNKDPTVDTIDSSNSRENSNNTAYDDSYSAAGNDVFIDRTISVKDWAASTFSDIPGQLWGYVLSLFPIATWIYRYNLTWFIGDVRF